MRKDFGFALVAVCISAVAVSACSAGGAHGGSTLHNNNGASTGSGASGGFDPLNGSGGTVMLVAPPDAGGGLPNDSDPGNPNITHPTCGMGACSDFPAAPLLGDGVPGNAASLFGSDPTKFSA